MDEPSELLRRQRLFSIELSGVLNKSASGRERERGRRKVRQQNRLATGKMFFSDLLIQID